MTLNQVIWSIAGVIVLGAVFTAFLPINRRKPKSPAPEGPPPSAVEVARQRGVASNYDPVEESLRLIRKWAYLNLSDARAIESLTVESAENLIAELAAIAKRENYDFLVGVHTGGRLISVVIGELIGLAPHKIAFAHTERTRNAAIEFNGKNNTLFGSVLIVDDICRTGSTLEALNFHLTAKIRSRDLDISDLAYAALVVVRNKHIDALAFALNWAPAYTDDPHFSFPWADRARATKQAYIAKRSQLDFGEPDRKAIAEHERLAADYGAALAVAYQYLDRDRLRAKYEAKLAAILAAPPRKRRSEAGRDDPAVALNGT